jgi:hypothetical protein
VHKDQDKARALQRAAYEKINSITTQVAQAHSLSLTARVIEVLPPELLEHVNEYPCDTRTIDAYDILHYLHDLEILINMPMLQELQKSSSKVTNFQVLCTFVDMPFAQQLIEHWYRRTTVNFCARELRTDGQACRDSWVSSIVPHIFIRTLSIKLMDENS